MRRLGLCITLLALTAALVGVTPARAEDKVEVTFEGPIEIVDLLKATAEALDVPLVWDPKSRGIQNKTAFGDLQFEGTRAEIFRSIRAMLTFYELVVIPVGTGANQKMLVADARQTAAIVKLKPTFVALTEHNLHEYESQDGLFLTTTIHTRHLDNLRDARNALNRIVTGQNIGNITEVPAAQAFVVTDFAPNVVAIWRLIREMDVPPEDLGPDTADRAIVFESFRLKHAPATEAASTLRDHFALTPPKPVPGQARGQTAAPVPSAPALRIDPDARLNTVLVTGMRKDVERVAEVLKVMDQPLPRTATAVQLIRLEHIRSATVASVLSALVHTSPALWTYGPNGVDKPSIQSHVETNAILLSAPEPALTTLSRLIADLDRAPADEDADEGE